MLNNERIKILFTIFRNDEDCSSYNYVTEWKYLTPEQQNEIVQRGKFVCNEETFVMSDDYRIATPLCELIDPCSPVCY